ncbi:MAG: EAL domain-containing protein [Ferrimicrobium sp.]
MTTYRPRFGVLDGGGVREDTGPSSEIMRLRAIVESALEFPSTLELYYQPIVNLQGARTVGYEVLSRFSRARGVSPDKVFVEADAMGLGAELEALVIERALAERACVPKDAFLTINVSPRLLDHPQLRRAFGRDLAGVVVELTEHVAVDDAAVLADSLAWLRARGALIAMDDAGSDYSGLKMLAAIRPDIVKLDRDLVAGVDRDDVKALVCSTFGDFVGRLDAWLLAEGVETPGELARISQLGVPLAQGWALGYPTPTPVALDDSLRETLTRLRPRPMAGSPVEWLMDPVVVEPYIHHEQNSIAAPLLSGSFVCVVNEYARPERLYYGGASCWEQIPLTLIVYAQEEIGEVAVRSLSRCESDRFAPILCIDTTGRPIGVVRMERLVNHLALDALPT